MGSGGCFTQVEHPPFYVAARGLARLPLYVVLPQGCGPGMPGPYAKRPPFDKGGFSRLSNNSCRGEHCSPVPVCL